MLLRRDDRADDSRQLHRDTRPLRHVPVVDDADDAGVDRRLAGQKRKRRFAAAHEEHVFAHARADRVGRDERAAGRLPVGQTGCSTRSLWP